VEAQTNRMEQQALDYFRQIDELGGVLPAIERGFFQSEIAEAAYRYQREIDAKERLIVGVNAYNDQAALKVPILEMDAKGEKRQVARLKKLRKERDNAAAGQALDKLRIACEGTENTMPALLAAVSSYATLGEIMSVMKGVFGTYEESNQI